MAAGLTISGKFCTKQVFPRADAASPVTRLVASPPLQKSLAMPVDQRQAAAERDCRRHLKTNPRVELTRRKGVYFRPPLKRALANPQLPGQARRESPSIRRTAERRALRHLSRTELRGVPPVRDGDRVVSLDHALTRWIGLGGFLEGDRFSVRRVRHGDGKQSYWIFTPDLEVHRPSLNVLCRYKTSTQQTYAYSLVDHLNWLLVNGKTPDAVTLDDLRRYMNGVTGQLDGVYGTAWRRPTQKPLGASAAGNVASVVKAYYLALAVSENVNPSLVAALQSGHAVSRGRSGRMCEANPLAPKKAARRPRFLPDEVVQALFAPGVLTTARDIMVVTWLHDAGIRVGGLCGLRFSDLHLIRHHPCGQRADPHIHIVGRDDNPNGARAKTHAQVHHAGDGTVLDGVIRAVSADMISTFHAYLLDEFHPIQHLTGHDQVLVHIRARLRARR